MLPHKIKIFYARIDTVRDLCSKVASCQVIYEIFFRSSALPIRHFCLTTAAEVEA